ncbi:glycosyl hydrolase family 28-related protein [Streptomyces microflavus]|uniref:right-handed parallel beta-helix repeat-containing protein n=1 Tax=Streptomyces microflavus TaxID=1919 RepID=UPI00365E032B
MARQTFGQTLADFVVAPADGIWMVAAGAEVTFWDGPVDGGQHTDLLTAAAEPATSIFADQYGALPTFQGPDGIVGMWADAGGTSRAWIAARDTGTSTSRLDWLIVTDPAYGAAGDGIRDDTFSIQAAIDACDPGGTVYFPRGVYKTTATLDLGPGVTLLGSHANLMIGPGMTADQFPCYIQPAEPFTGTSVLQIIGDATDGEHPDISGEQRLTNLMLDGSQLTGTTIDGLFARGNVQNVVLQNVCIRRMPNNGIATGSRISDGQFPYSWRLNHVMLNRNAANGLWLRGNTDLTLLDCQALGNFGQGFVLTNCANSQLIGCRAEWNGSNGYRMTGNWGDWAGSGALQMTGCATDRNGHNGILIDSTGAGPFLIDGLATRRDGRNGGAGGGGYAGLAVSAATNPVLVSSVTCYPGNDDGGGGPSSPQYGARFTGNTYVAVSGGFLHAVDAGWSNGGTNTVLRRGLNIAERSGSTSAPVNNYAPPTDVGGNLSVGGYLTASSGQSNGQWNANGTTAKALNVGGTGGGIAIKEGGNTARLGVTQLVAGTVTVPNTSVTANTRINLFRQSPGGTLGHLSVTRTAATSFVITSSSATDTSFVAYELIEPS